MNRAATIADITRSAISFRNSRNNGITALAAEVHASIVLDEREISRSREQVDRDAV